ncbi:MAG: hypothetical protein N4A43_00405 [Alphaproteobacteria bacterium]|jgi:hypothetical protein|nr:hypothetical protein [Alphaproteobacteria bacterium]
MFKYFSQEEKKKRAKIKTAKKIANKLYNSLSYSAPMITPAKSGAEELIEIHKVSFRNIDCIPTKIEEKSDNINQLIFDNLFNKVYNNTKNSYAFFDKEKIPSFLLFCQEAGANKKAISNSFSLLSTLICDNAITSENKNDNMKLRLIKVVKLSGLSMNNQKVNSSIAEIGYSLSRDKTFSFLSDFVNTIEEMGVDIGNPENKKFKDLFLHKVDFKDYDKTVLFFKDKVNSFHEKQKKTKKIKAKKKTKQKAYSNNYKKRNKNKTKNDKNNKPPVLKNKKSNDTKQKEPIKKYTSITYSTYM